MKLFFFFKFLGLQHKSENFPLLRSILRQYFAEHNTANVCKATEKGEKLGAGRLVERQQGGETHGGRMH